MTDRPSGGSSGAPPPTDEKLRVREERVEAIQVALRKLAHTLNNQLTPLLGYSGMLSTSIPEEGEAAKFLEKIEESGKRVRDSIEGILLALRPGRRFYPQRFDLNALVAEIVGGQTDSAVEKRVDLRLGPGPIEIESDPKHWRAALGHVLANAWEAQNGQGITLVEAAKTALDPERAKQLGVAAQEVVELSISDQGSGMPPAVLDHACDAFFTTKQAGIHQGMGLSAAHAVARHSGGQLLLQNLVPRGCKVTFLIPLATRAAEVASPDMAPASKTRPSGDTILVVDDDPEVLAIVRDGLQMGGHKVEVAADGLEAWQRFSAAPQRYAMVVTDLTMPRMDGAELFRNIRTVSPDLEVLIVSGDAEHSGRIDFARLGPNPPQFIPKPFSMQDLRSRVAVILGRPLPAEAAAGR